MNQHQFMDIYITVQAVLLSSRVKNNWRHFAFIARLFRNARKMII